MVGAWDTPPKEGDMNSFLDQVLSNQQLIEKAFGTSAIDAVMRQARMVEMLEERYTRYDKYFAHSAAAEAMKQANVGQRLAEQYGDQSISRYVESLGGPTRSTERFLRQMEETSAAARHLMLAQSHKGIENILSNEAYRSLARWQDLMSRDATQLAMESIQFNAFNIANELDKHLSIASSMGPEIAAAHDMMFRPEWAALNDQVVRSLRPEFGDFYDDKSVYRELLRRIEQGDFDSSTSVEEEAESYFQAIKNFLAQHVKRLTPHDLLVITHVLIGVIFELHLQHQLGEIRAELAQVRAEATKREDDANAHTSAVVETLWKKLEPKFAELAQMAEASDAVRWMARERAVAVRHSPRNGEKVVGVLLPNQVVTELDHRGKWLQVEFQDHKAGVPFVGWVLKKHVRRVSSKRQTR